MVGRDKVPVRVLRNGAHSPIPQSDVQGMSRNPDCVIFYLDKIEIFLNILPKSTPGAGIKTCQLSAMHPYKYIDISIKSLAMSWQFP